VPARWERLSLYRRRREAAGSLWAGLGTTAFGVLFALPPGLALVVPDIDGWDWLWVGLMAALAVAVVVLGVAFVVTSVRMLRPVRDHVWVDDGYLLWSRWYPGIPYAAEPTWVPVADILEVRLTDGERAVVVRTADGDHTVTDLGTVSRRVDLAAAIGALVRRSPEWHLRRDHRTTDDGAV
jgi:hypothetical protein